MKKAYNRTIWENYPSDASPIDEQNLNNMEVGIDEVDNRIVLLDNTKLDKMEAGTFVQDISLDQVTGIITITYYSGATKQIDTLLEKIAVNFDYDPDTQKLTITLDDGEIKEIDLSTLIAEYEFDDTDTVAISLNGGRVSAIVKNGSITDVHLRPDYLADIKVESAKAEASANAAAKSEANAKLSETAAANSAAAALSSADFASASAENSKNSAESAGISKENAANSANAAAISEENAKNSENNAKSSELSAADSADSAIANAAIAAHKADEARNNATKAESYTHGDTGTRENEDVDNALYYYEQAKHISQAGNGLVPMGTVTFEKLPTVNIETNAMYNISNDFVSDSRFLDGGGIFYGKGSNVYYTVDKKWDVLAASSVTGVKGDTESFYRQGNVNITPADIGLGNVDNTADSVKNVAFAANADAVDGKHAEDLQDYNNLTNKPILGEAASRAVANNLTTTAAGSVLDARQGKVLNDKVTELDGNLRFPDGAGFYADIKDGVRGYNTDPARGADTFHPFSVDSGDHTPVLLWTNPTPNLNSNQAGDIVLDLSEYEAVAFIFNAATNVQFGGTLSTPIPVIDEGTTPLSYKYVGATVYKDTNHTTVEGILRANLYATKTKISYGGGTCIWYSGGVSFINGIIREVYGYKKSPIPQEE